MVKCLHIVFTLALSLAAACIMTTVHAQIPSSEIGVVVMHGKGGSPGRYVNELAQALEQKGFQVANLEMPWSGNRHYDVDMNGAANEITAALDAMRAKGAKKVFVSGHSQGGLFALYYGGQHRVDGLIAIAPGGQVDAYSFVNELGQYVGAAKSMVDAGRGDEKAVFSDYEGSRGTTPVTTTAAIYLSWFDPAGAHTTRIFKNVRAGIPVLFIAPTRDYPGLAQSKHANFSALPHHAMTRMFEPESSHLNAPSAVKEEIIRWIDEVAGNP